MNGAIEDGKLTLHDGTQIDVMTGKKVKTTTTSYEIPNTTQAQDMVIATRRKLSDLPTIPEHMNVVGVILAYSLFGLAEDEVAIATGLPIDQIHRIKMMSEYDRMHTAVVEQVMKHETTQVKDYITQASMKAAKKMVELVDSETEVVSQIAAKDILDRAGHRPADFIAEQRSKSETDLTIKFVKEDRTKPMPTIDLKPINKE